MASGDAQHLPLATDEEEANDHVELGTLPSSPTGNKEHGMETVEDEDDGNEDADEEVNKHMLCYYLFLLQGGTLYFLFTF